MTSTPGAPTAADRGPLQRVVVLIPTYNERDALPLTLGRLRRAVPDVDVLVLEDNSPDGTGEVADRLAADDDRVQVMHRQGKEGLGKAYLAGFRWALEHGYDAVVEMDADGSHQPEQLHRLLTAAADADLVIGSRYVRGGAVENWPWHRQALSRGGNLYIRAVLGMGVHDATAGFRVYRASALRTIGLDHVESHGYCFQTDLTLRAAAAGLRIVEVPITFVEREIGASKMSKDIVRESLVRITGWGLARRAAQVRRLAGAAGRTGAGLRQRLQDRRG